MAAPDVGVSLNLGKSRQISASLGASLSSGLGCSVRACSRRGKRFPPAAPRDVVSRDVSGGVWGGTGSETSSMRLLGGVDVPPDARRALLLPRRVGARLVGEQAAVVPADSQRASEAPPAAHLHLCEALRRRRRREGGGGRKRCQRSLFRRALALRPDAASPLALAPPAAGEALAVALGSEKVARGRRRQRRGERQRRERRQVKVGRVGHRVLLQKVERVHL